MQGKLLAVFTVCFMLLAISIASQGIDADTDVDNTWPFVGGDLQNTGRSDHDTSHVDGDILWNETIADALVPSDTSPVLDHEDNMYFSGGNIIISLDSSGERRWEYFFADGELTAPGLGADGTVYVGARTVNSLIALDREDGSVLWTFETIGNVTTAPVVNNDGAIYFATHIKGEESSRVYSIGTDGNQRWVFDMPKVDNSTKVNARVAVGSNGWIYFGSFDNYVYALNQHGELEWKTDPAPAWGTTTQIFSSPAIDEGRVYVGTIDGMAALDAYTGESIWHFPDERHEEFEFGDQVSVWASPAIGQGGRIYFGCTYTIPAEQAYTNPVRMGRIYALYPSGDVRWHMETQNIMMSATPVVGKEGTIYMGTNDRAVYAFEPSGTILWNRSIARVIDSSPAIGSDGTVYFVTGGPIPIVYAFGGGWLFRLNRSDFEYYLKEGGVDDELKKAFEDNGHELDKGAELVEEEGVWWIVENGEKIYRIEVDQEQLTVYDSDPPTDEPLVSWFIVLGATGIIVILVLVHLYKKKQEQ